MTIYTVRPGFTVVVDGEVYIGGQQVDLSDLEFDANKHKLEGVESDVVPIEVGNGACYPPPYVSEISPTRLFLGFDAEVSIKGSFFTPVTTVAIEGTTINNIEFVDSHCLKISLTVGNIQKLSNLVIDNGNELIIEDAIELFDAGLGIIDLRLGGTNFSNSAIETRSGMNFTRTVGGLYFTGRSPWSSWARFVGDNDAWVWNRSEKRSLSWIFKNTSSFMLGIGSRAINPTSSTQYTQAEILGYFSSATNFSGFYGNRGTPGVDTRQSVFVNNLGEYKKITMTNNGEAGSVASVYNLPSSEISDWFNVSEVAATITIGNNFTADESEIMPFVIPSDGNSSLFLGMILL